MLSRPCRVSQERLSLDYDGRRLQRLFDATYQLELHDAADATGCALTLRLAKPVVRHGADGVVHGKSGESMFCYFSPRCEVQGTITVDGQIEQVVSGRAWYDHEFGHGGQFGSTDSVGSVSWEWIGAQLDNGWDLSIYCMVDDTSGASCGRFAILVDPNGRPHRYAACTFDGHTPWTSSKTFATYLGASHVLRTGYGLQPTDQLAREFARELIGYKQRTMRRDPRYRLDVLGVDAAKLLDVPWLLATLLELHRRVVRLRRLVPRLLTERAGYAADAPGWLDGLAGEQLPLRELTDGLNHLYGAYSAVDFVITAAVYELSRHVQWRERIRTELDSVLGERSFPVADDIPRLPLTWSAIKEVLRLYPVAMGIFRQTGAALDVDGERLPAGTQVVVLPYALHRHPEYWDSPPVFDPHRWAPSRPPHTPFTYLPFLVGPRKCMGQPLAELELLIVVSTLVRSFDVDVSPQAVPLTSFLVPRFATDLPFELRRIAQPARQPAA